VFSVVAHEFFGLKGYGMSGPADQVYNHFELTVSRPSRISVLVSTLTRSCNYSPRVSPSELRRSSTSTRSEVARSTLPSSPLWTRSTTSRSGVETFAGKMELCHDFISLVY
jgi:hypothetical protein